jgi:hypothetical protein
MFNMADNLKTFKVQSKINGGGTYSINLDFILLMVPIIKKP